MTITATAPRAAAYRGRLRWWTELPLIAVIYALYSFARLLVRGDIDDAVKHGVDILHFEQLTHLDPEPFVNRLFTDHAVLGVPADFAYASLHYLVTPAVLVWLWRRRPTHYRAARTWLMISTLIGLIGFTLLPTAPPRLIPTSHGFVDTMAQYGSYGWWGTDASAPRGMGHLTNEYAAMPSLHVGWALWCGIMLVRYGRHWSIRVLGGLYPVVTTLVVMGTANHYLMDVLAGCAVMGTGFLLARPGLRFADLVHARLVAALGRDGDAQPPAGGVPQSASEAARVRAGHVPAPRAAGDAGAVGEQTKTADRAADAGGPEPGPGPDAGRDEGQDQERAEGHAADGGNDPDRGSDPERGRHDTGDGHERAARARRRARA